MKSGDLMQKLGDMGATGRASASTEEARKLMRSEIDKWKVVIDRAGIERQHVATRKRLGFQRDKGLLLRSEIDPSQTFLP